MKRSENISNQLPRSVVPAGIALGLLWYLGIVELFLAFNIMYAWSWAHYGSHVSVFLYAAIAALLLLIAYGLFRLYLRLHPDENAGENETEEYAIAEKPVAAILPAAPSRSRRKTQSVRPATIALTTLVILIPVNYALLPCIAQPFQAWSHNRHREVRSEAAVIQKALEQYRIDHGFYPNALDELKPVYLASIPVPHFGKQEWEYSQWKPSFYLRCPMSEDPKLPEKQSTIETAIRQYRTDTGLFPDSLDRLVPKHLESIPEPRQDKWLYTYNDHSYQLKFRYWDGEPCEISFTPDKVYYSSSSF